MLVTLTNTDRITLDLPVDAVSWPLTSTRQDGEASFTIPRGSDAMSSTYISDTGGTLVEIRHGSLPLWRGVCREPVTGRAGMRVSAVHITRWTKLVPVALSGRYVALTAGAIAYAAVQSAVTGIGAAVLRAGTFVEAAPVIPEYTFQGQKLAEVLDDLAERTGQEWAISDDGAISWLPRQGSLYDRWLCDSGDLADGQKSAAIDEQTLGIKVRDAQGREAAALYLSDRMNTPLWPKVDVISVGSSSAAVAGTQAIQQLAGRRGSAVSFTFRVKKRPGA